MRFLHISDLHITDSADHRRTVDALCRDLENITSQKEIDAILCTGDIANRGDTSEIAIGLQEKTINKIISSIRNKTHFICCPGNHDINLKARKEIYKSIFESTNSSEKANTLVESTTTSPDLQVWAHLSGYIELSKKINPESYKNNILYTTQKLTIGNKSVGIASLNSTWRTFGGGEIDRNNLYLGERQVEYAIKEIEDCDFKIALMHHTLEWLTPEEAIKIRRLFSENFDALLCGHNHNNNAGQTISTLGNLLVSNTGCIYESREHFNGYSIIEVIEDESIFRVEAREYYSQRNEFDVSPRFAPSGVSDFSLTKKKNTSKITISSAAITAALERANSKLLSFSASEIAPKHISSIFVEPPLAKISEKHLSASEGIDDNPQKDEFVDLQSLSREEIDILFIGKRESGKSTLLHHIAVNKFMEFHSNARLGLLVDISSLSKFTIPAILSQAIDFVGNEITKKEIIELLRNGEALVIFDSINMHSKEHRKLIEDFKNEYPAPRYIFATNEEVQDDLTIKKIPPLTENTTSIYLHSFKSKQTKELVRKWFGEHDPGAEEKLGLIRKLLLRLNIPNTPFLVSILLWVIEQQPNSKIINQASAIETLVVGLLEKFTESKARSNYDSNIQSHFLSELATEMDRAQFEWIDSNEFESFVNNYFVKRGLTAPSRGFTDELLRKGLLYENNNRITFKFDCFRAFFLAKRLAESNDALLKILTPSTISKYSPELDLLTGLHRDRKDILIRARECCEELLQSSGLDTDIKKFETYGREEGIFNREENLKLLEDDFNSALTDEAHRAQMIEKIETPSKASIDHDHARRRPQVSPSPSSAQMRFIAALRTYSNILRNSELVDDIELKRTCLLDNLTLWSKVLVSISSQVSEMESSEMPEKIFTQFGTLSPGQFKELAKILVPQLFSILMTESLATPKLEKFVIEETKNPDQCIRFLSTMLAIENLNKQSIQVTKSTLLELSNNNTITQAIFLRLLSLYYLEAPPSILNDLRDCIGDAFMTLRKVSSTQRAAIKGKFLQHIEKKRKTNSTSEN